MAGKLEARRRWWFGLDAVELRSAEAELGEVCCGYKDGEDDERMLRVPLHAADGAGRRRRAEEVDAARLRLRLGQREEEDAKQRKKREKWGKK